MTEITVEERCGNSPRKQFLKEFYVAFAKADIEDIRSRLTDDIRLTVVGDVTVNGKQDVTDLLTGMLDEELTEIRVDNIITHGYTAAANGVLRAANGDTHAFCEVFTFDGATKTADIEAIDSYVIEEV